jgi:hypothetical protein
VPVAAWEGVTFGEPGGADLGRVVRIKLGLDGYRPRPRLTGHVPAELGRLTALKTLHLNGNHLRSVPLALEGQGLTLVHFSAQLERFLWHKGCA